MKSARIRLASLLVLSSSALVMLAAPAGATTGTVLANEKFKWFYWIGFILAASMALWLLATLVGYYMRVLRPKWRGRQPS